METNTKEIQNELKHSFFGQANCLTISNGNIGSFMSIGKKNGTGWNWEAAKMSLPELGDIIAVLKGVVDKVSFFHQYEGKKTQIWVNKESEKGIVFFKIQDHAKPLNQGEQQVLQVILKEIILQRINETKALKE